MSLTIRIAHVTGANRPRLPMVPEWITVHETANTNVGANAEMHRRFVANGGGPERVSFQYVVDDREAVELIPPSEAAWHAGDGYQGAGNRKSIGIETCVNADGDWERTVLNLAELVATLCRRHGIAHSRVVQHNRWSGKNCPTRLRQGGWEVLLADVRGRLDGGHQPERTFFPETGHWLALGFRRYWLERGGLMVFGYPISEEYRRADGITVQWFERARFEHQPGRGQPYDVLLGRLGDEASAAERAAFPNEFARRAAA